MGFISSFVSDSTHVKGISLDSGLGNPRPLSSDSTAQSRQLWREVFGEAATHKEEGHRSRPVPGGSYGRSSVSSEASFKRLLQAMRSMAPGGWSDDRWEQSRGFTGIAYVAIHRICTQMQQSEFRVLVKDPRHQDGKREIKEGEPGWKLVELLEKPNNQDSFGKWMYRVGQQMRLTGTALTWMVPNVVGTPMELYCVPTALAIPQPAINPDYPDGYYRIQPIYPYGPFSSYPTPASAVGAPIPAQWMLRFQYPHPLLRYDGYSPLTGVRLHKDEVEMIDRSRHYTMRRQIHPSAALTFEEMENAQGLPEEEIERIRAEFENDFMGPENSGRLYVATPGAKLEEWGTKAVDMDYAEGWKQLTAFVMGGGFGITMPAAGMVEDSSYATLFATLKQLHLITLKPDIDDIAASLTRHLAPYFGDNLIVEIKTPRIDDHDLKNQRLTMLVQAKGMTINELRKELDMELTNEEWGKERVGEQQQGGPGGPGGGMPGMEGLMGGGQSGEEKKPEPKKMEGAAEGMETASEGKPPVQKTPMRPESADESKSSQESMRPEPPEVTQTRPKPGNLGRGALGPRGKNPLKSLDNWTDEWDGADRYNNRVQQRLKKLHSMNGNGRS